MENNDVYLPIVNIILWHKSFEINDKILKEILNFLEYYNNKIDFSEKSFMTDYEHPLRTANKSNLHFIKITSCYFHYAKAIYKK